MTMVTRSGRVSKQPERFSPQERITDDYSDDDYSDYSDESDDVSSAVSYSTDEGNEYVEDGFVERDDMPVDRTDDEWVPEDSTEGEEEDLTDADEETFTDDEEAMKEAEQLKKNYREMDNIVTVEDEDEDEESFTDESDEDMSDASMDDEDSEGLIEGEEDFTDEESEDEMSEDEPEDDEMSEESFDESDEEVPIDPKESRKRVRKALADKDDRSFLHELGVDPSETRNLRGVPMLPPMELNDGDEPVDLTQ